MRRGDMVRSGGLRLVLCATVAASVAGGGLAVAAAQGDDAEEGVTYTAMVVDASTGAPIEGALVAVPGEGTVESGVDGTAVFQMKDDAAWQASAAAEGYQDAGGSALDASLGDVEESIALQPDLPADMSAPPTAPEADDVPEAEAPAGEAEAPDEPAPEADAQDFSKKPPVDVPASDVPAEGSSAEEPQAQPQRVPDETLDSVPVETAPPAWALSGNLPLSGNLSMAEEMRLLDAQLASQAAYVRNELGMPENTVVSYDADNAADVWAVYAVLSGMEEGFPYRVELPDDGSRELLRSVYWAMTSVQGATRPDGKHVVHVERKSWEECAEGFGLADRIEDLAVMVDAEGRAAVSNLYSQSIVSRLSDEEFEAVEERLSGLEGERRAVVLAALSLEGKVPYFYGGKSSRVGWNPAWGQIAAVSGDETLAGGSVEPYGLDCSGYVSWVFANAMGDAKAAGYVGEGTGAQWANSKAVSMSDAQPGDLVFLAGPEAAGANNHVGVVVSNEGGRLAVAHCSGSADNVVVTDASPFNHARTPYLYGEADV